MPWLRRLRLGLARLGSLRGGVPDAPVVMVRDPWPGDAEGGARLLKGELSLGGVSRPLRPGAWTDAAGDALLRAHAHGFTWLRDLRALGGDAARMRARALVADWIETGQADRLAQRPDVVGARIAAWLGHYDFFAASAEDGFRRRLMARLVGDARLLAALLPAEAQDARALTALKGVIAAATAMPVHANHLTRALRFLPAEIGRQFRADGSHAERSPAAQMAALQELIEMRGLLATGGASAPASLAQTIERAGLALRMLRHGDGGLALFNGSKEGGGREGEPALIELVAAQAGRTARAPASLAEGGFFRMQAGRTLLIVDAGTPAAPGLDRTAHAGTLAFEMSVGRERLIVNCGAAPAGGPWGDALRATAAHSTLVIADTSSSELRREGLGRRPGRVEAVRQEANGAHWLRTSHDGWLKPFGVIHRRQLYLAESGEDVRGEDLIEAASAQPFTLRFHLHPQVVTSLQEDGETVLLRATGGFWRLRAGGLRAAIEESVYLGGNEPRRSEQVVFAGMAEPGQPMKWAISKVAS